MTEQEIIQKLELLGLSNKEARIYCAALKHPNETMSGLSKNARVKRSTAYSAVEALSKKGFLVSTKDKKTTRYTALPPEEFLHIYKSAHQKLSIGLEKITPQKKAEAKKQLNACIKEALNTSTEKVFIVTNISESIKTLEYIFSTTHNLKKIIRILTNSTTKNLSLVQKMPIPKNCSISFMSQNKSIPGACIIITKEHTITSEHPYEYGVITHSPHIAQAVISLFKESWDSPFVSHKSLAKNKHALYSGEAN